MPKRLQSVDFELRPGGTVKFEGAPHGVAASFFHVKNVPGTGSSLHVHPYSETWLVCRGTACFTVGDQTLVAGPGTIVIAEPETPHKYLNIGDDLLEMFCLHPSPHILQESVAEPA